VTYFVKESTRGAGGVNTQVGNNEGTFGVGFQAPNIFGRGEKLRLSYDYGTKRSASFFTEYTKPLVKYGCSKYVSPLPPLLSK
jgi:outer membrane protein assembly factor BamA